SLGHQEITVLNLVLRGVLVLPILTVDSPDEEALVRAIDAFEILGFIGSSWDSSRKVFVRNFYGHAKVLLDPKQERLEVCKRWFRIAAGVGRDDYLAHSADEFVEA
ncbi:MAG: hypothetical protein VX090_02555, partial [Pseudomonadota bacterium]|nr:hypothetical protein [Pseudomonadota bacterium]